MNHEVKEHPLGGIQHVFEFDNGYGASVVQFVVDMGGIEAGSYGGAAGLWELAVIEAKTGKIVYDTPITSDVIGWLKWEEVEGLLKSIKDLPNRHGIKAIAKKVWSALDED